MLINNLKTLLLLPLLFAIQNTLAQTSAHLILSNQYPAVGEQISFTYNPDGTVLSGSKHISAIVFFLGNTNKNFPIDIDLKPDGKLLKGKFTSPIDEKAFLIKIYSGELVDNNNGEGYMYLFYKDKKPVEGAYASKAVVLSRGSSPITKIKRDLNLGIALFKKEFELYPQSEKKYWFDYYSALIDANKYREIVNQKIYNLEQSNEEDDLSMAVYLLHIIGHRKSADSLDDVIRKKFPDGYRVRMDLDLAFIRENDLYKKESLYKVYIQRYPANTEEQKENQDDLSIQLANEYLKRGDLDNFYKWESELTHKTNIAGWINTTVLQWAKDGIRLETAEQLSKLALDMMAEQIGRVQPSLFTSLSMAKEAARQTYDSYADTYALILFKENKFAEALKYEQPVIDHNAAVDSNVWEHYIQILGAVGEYAKAKETAEKCIRANQGTDVTKDELKKDYIKLKGSSEGYDQYLSALENPPNDVELPMLARQMIKQPAPHFTLTDIYGKAVSLADLTGKIVIIDFGETFCGHCKISFNRMQLVVDKYNDNPTVKFLFVDTEDHSEHFFVGIQKYITDNHYNFTVGPEGKSGIASAFGVSGLSATFIIDKSGNIRFKYINFDGKPERLRDELANMIELAAKDN